MTLRTQHSVNVERPENNVTMQIDAKWPPPHTQIPRKNQVGFKKNETWSNNQYFKVVFLMCGVGLKSFPIRGIHTTDT